MDPFYEALSLYRRRRFEKCATVCTGLLDTNPYDQAVWTLKMKALTAQVMVDDIEADEEGIADTFLDTETIAVAARPGTSLRTAPVADTPGGMRPRASTGRAVSGMVRPATQTGRMTSLENALKTPRTARSARPVTSHAARTLRLGTASMMTQPDGPFIQVTRLNLAKYATMEGIAKPLFLYIFYHENDVRNALDLAVEATKAAQFKDPWWKVALAKCYSLLGLSRDAEAQLRSALRQQPTVEGYLRLSALYTKLDQPLSVLEVCNAALQVFPSEVSLLTDIARLHIKTVHINNILEACALARFLTPYPNILSNGLPSYSVLEALNNIPSSVKYYREVLMSDAMNVEAIACIAVNYFYSDQPEVALCFYRRLLQMGLYNAELFTNIGLCCYYAQHYDMVVSCFERALSLAVDETAADVWYNIAHIAIGVGELMIAIQCLRLAISIDSNHGSSYNNLGVLLSKKGQRREALGYFLAAQGLGPYLFEPFYNHALLTKNTGDLQTSYNTVQKGLKTYPNHMPSKDILKSLEKHFKSI